MDSIINNRQEVTVTDIDMPFWSMVKFMLKWSIATIPAAIILIAASFGAVVIGMIILATLGLGINSLPK